MMRMRNKINGLSPMNGRSAGGVGVAAAAAEWEMRPGGMLVQRRTANSDRNSVPAPTIRVRVKYGSIYHEVNISSQATFGDVKKMLCGPTGLHHQDQRLFYKDKERDSNAFLDMVGVKDKSKLVLQEDPVSLEKRYLEMKKNAEMEKAAKSIFQISLEVDRLAGQVSALESIISKGKKVAESDVISLIEQLMNQLLKLDGIMADGDVKLQRKMQVRRVQKYVENLDMLKIKNSMASTSGGRSHNKHYTQQKQRLEPIQEQRPQRHSNGRSRLGPLLQQQEASNKYSNRHSLVRHTQQEASPKHSKSGVVVTTKWEKFDSTPSPPLVPATSASTSTSSSTSATKNKNNSLHPRFNWEFFG